MTKRIKRNVPSAKKPASELETVPDPYAIPADLFTEPALPEELYLQEKLRSPIPGLLGKPRQNDKG